MNTAKRTALALALSSFACGADGERPPPSEDNGPSQIDPGDPKGAGAGDDVADGPCEAGATKQCRIYLPSHNDIRPCFVGEQVCEDGRWSDCGDTVLVDANADDAELDPELLEN